jgi:hypothetical protein
MKLGFIILLLVLHLGWIGTPSHAFHNFHQGETRSYNIHVCIWHLVTRIFVPTTRTGCRKMRSVFSHLAAPLATFCVPSSGFP